MESKDSYKSYKKSSKRPIKTLRKTIGKQEKLIATIRELRKDRYPPSVAFPLGG